MRILVIDPGSTSTKIGLYDGDCQGGRLTVNGIVRHERPRIDRFERIVDQEEMRFEAVEAWLESERQAGRQIPDAVVGRGGLIRPVAGGTYRVNEAMLADLRRGVSGRHAANLGGILAYRFAAFYGVPAYIVDPVVVDELEPEARYSGLNGIERRSIFHALNQKAVARRAAAALDRRYEEVHLIVAHLGGGISVGAHRAGRVIDVNNALNGDGPFAPERSGGLPLDGIARFLRENGTSVDDLLDATARRGGLYSYLGEVDLEEVLRRVDGGDEAARLAFRAMAYQVAREIGALAAVLSGEVDRIVLTGGGARCERLVSAIEERVRFIAPVAVIPGELELEALAEGTRRVLCGEESAKRYPPEDGER